MQQTSIAVILSLRSSVSAGMAAGPILPNAKAAASRTVVCLSFSSSLRAGTASLASGLIDPKSQAARARIETED